MKKSYSNPTPRLQGIWRGLAGLKMRSKIIVLFLILFYVEIVLRQSYLFANGKHRVCYNPTNWYCTKCVLWMKPLQWLL